MQKQQATKRTSREAQYNARVQAAYESIRPVDMPNGDNGNYEAFSVASGSEPGKRYIVTHAYQTHLYHCDCLAGQHERECVHVLAAKRYVTERTERHNAEAEMAYQMEWPHGRPSSAAATPAAAYRQSSHPGDTALMRRDNRAFSARWMR